MKLLFFSHYYPPEGNAPASRVHALCRRWVAAGHEVTVVTCAPNVPNGVVYPGYRNAWRNEEQVEGVRVVRCWTYVAANQGTLRRIASYVSYMLSALWQALFFPRPDVVLATSPQFFCGWAGVWAARFHRRPLVLEIRDLWPESIQAVGAFGGASPDRVQRVLIRALCWLERRMYRGAERIVTVGEGYKQALLERGVAPERIDVVPNGVETELFQPRAADPALRAEAGAGERDFLVAYVGTVGMAHGLDVVLRAAHIARARGLDRLRFALVGDGAELETLRAKLHADDPGNVRLLGRRSKFEMPAWLASADACLVHLKATETFRAVLPSKIFEALAMERPILLGVRGQAEWVLRSCGGGLCFEPEDAGALVECATDLMARADRGASFGRDGRASVLARYHFDDLAGRYLQRLAQVAGVAASFGPDAPGGPDAPDGLERESAARNVAA